MLKIAAHQGGMVFTDFAAKRDFHVIGARDRLTSFQNISVRRHIRLKHKRYPWFIDNMHSPKISFERIRTLAEDTGREEWKVFLAEGELPILDECLNVQRAWMFFRNPEIRIPLEASMRKCAIVVSDRGEVRTTADFYPDLNKCREYLQIMSDHFEERGL